MNIDPAKIGILAAGLLAGVILTIGVVFIRDREAQAPIRILPPEPTPTHLPTSSPAPITVFVSGEVLMPDVYTLAPDSRIKQLVEAAGGFTVEANTVVVNLAQPLSDGAHVHIPAEGELAPTLPALPAAPAPLQTPDNSALGSGGDLININTADLLELELLPGIGPVTAQKILDYRMVNGPFADKATLMEVSGIGKSKFDQIKELITISQQ